ncbi:O-linked beta-N-acetylglucosamine transferase [Synechococcus sp. PROS-7-1]|uniref:tetratricopeptide repeat protein n=1 Tax=Synechococcus sp. PROS-7-1 TaxID=1442556 RepID=UPI00164888AB|nr:glycosyltransferase family 41 protein [Synechococcus sp. PROS-7-1]QNI83973.1 O-linked beta-N-acetylglucosamine transferase [Synechococcus sp. PROS-7-1]
MNAAQLRQQAVEAHRAGHWHEAEQAYLQLMAEAPAADLAANYGSLLRSQGRLDAAEAHYGRALAAFPDDVHLLCNACNLLRDQGKAAITVDLLQQALQRSSGNHDLTKALALSLHHCDRVDEALQLLPRLVSAQPGCSELRLEYGACLAKRDAPREAIAQFREALAIAPNDPRALANLIILLAEQGGLQEARTALERGDVDQESPRMLGARAQLLMSEGDAEGALALHQRLTGLEPAVADHWLNVAACHKELRRMVAPTQALRQAVRLAPERPDLQLALGSLLVEQGHSAEGLRLLQGTLDQPGLKDEPFTVHQFITAGHRLLPAEQLRQEVERWEQRRALPLQEIWQDRIRDPDPQRRLRVGFLSADFSKHPVGRFMAPLLEAHDPEQLELVGLSCGRLQDHFTERIRAACSSWHELRFGRDEEVARLLADLQLDVIVELGGYTAQQRLRPLTARPAPIQLSYLGYPASTYLRCIDGWIGDAACFGPAQLHERGVNEQLLVLPRAYLAYPQPEEAPLPERTAADQRFRFGSFNHSRKLGDGCLDRFVAVLQAVPDSVLVLKSTTFEEQAERDRIQGRLMQRGLAPERLELLPRSVDQSAHLASYGQVDVALDTWPYSGTTTSCEALWMGVPVLTVMGQVMVERQTASVLAAAGLGSAISRSLEEMVQKARLAAAQGPRDQPQRLALRAHVAASDLADSASLARAMEALYRQLWQRRSYAARL